MKICVIGAGPSGLTATKHLLDAGFLDVTVYDRGSEVGGNWVFDAESGHSSVFETTHIISSKTYSQYEDFPMPAWYPDYPGHEHLAQYFQAYARHFDLYTHIRFGTLVTRCERDQKGRWRVTVRPTRGASGTSGPSLGPEEDEETHTFDQLVVCNGHHWKPRWPHYPGTFTGEYLHSHAFKRAEPFRDRRVLVIGGGNSACDCAVETARVSARTDLSWRRGYWIVPKFIFGIPGDVLHNRIAQQLGFVPWRIRRPFLQLLLRLYNGPSRAYGLPEPDHPFGATHPTINSELLYFLRHGEIHPKPDVIRFEGREVHFSDGTRAEYDAVIACTGFVISHPFFPDDLVDYSEGPVPLYLKMVHPRFENLHFIGLVQPLGCIWPLAELQSRILARRLQGAWAPPADLDQAIRKELANPDLPQLATPRHTITVDYPAFRKRLLRELAS
ncbi:MAG: NAD(P)-binding domain-containing protein [Gemmatimonadales bacterium]|nr:MAG: NAD(P)-binding domain-containing protein [Gemmatimonadales bacterium]